MRTIDVKRRTVVVEWIEQWSDCPLSEAVWISVARADRLWKLDDDYIGPGGTGAALGNRYANVGRWVAARQPMWLSLITLTEGMISFTDGRHRFAWMRDHGAEALPISASNPEDVRRALGVKNRVCRVFLN